MHNIYLKLRKVFLKYFFLLNFNLVKKNSIIKDFTINSLDIIELFMLLEKEFKIKFSDYIVSKFATVKLIINFIIVTKYF